MSGAPMTSPRLHRLVFLVLAFVASGSVASADEGLLIWNPSKSSDTAYNARLGLHVPGWTFASAGVDVGVNAAGKGGPVDVPIKVWGRITANAVQTPAYQIRRDFDVRMNALNGSGAALMSYSNKQIITGDLDLALSRNMALTYDGLAQSWSGVDVSQALRLVNASSGTAFVVKAGALDTLKRLGGGLAVEKQIGDHIRITGQLDDSAGADVSARIDARYALTW
jgi:hypothetical protein